MNHYTGTQAQLDYCERQAPGYTRIIMPALIRREDDRYVWDLDHPAAAAAKAHREQSTAKPDAQTYHRNTDPKPSRKLTPGQVLKRVIRSITGETPTASCGCTDRAAQMDAWGWRGCWRNRKTITAWLVEEAEKRGHTIDGRRAWGLIRAAIHEARNQ